MISFETPDGYSVDVVSGGDASLQVICDHLNQTHFAGELPPISVFAAESLIHPTVSPIDAFTFKTDEVPELAGLQTPWLILIHKDFSVLPFLAQLLIHEMTHVYLPDEQPHHSEKFWNTLREKWLLDADLVLGVGLNGDETPKGLTKELLDQTSILRLWGW